MKVEFWNSFYVYLLSRGWRIRRIKFRAMCCGWISWSSNCLSVHGRTPVIPRPRTKWDHRVLPGIATMKDKSLPSSVFCPTCTLRIYSPPPFSKCCNHVTSPLNIRQVRISVRKCPICKNVSTVLSQILATNRFQIFYVTIYKKYNFNSIYRNYINLKSEKKKNSN